MVSPGSFQQGKSGQKLNLFFSILSAVVDWVRKIFCVIITGSITSVTLALLATVISVLSGHLFADVVRILKQPIDKNPSLFKQLVVLELFPFFVVLICIFILLFLLHDYFVKSGVEKERANLYRTIRSMPPIGIMGKFSELYRKTTEYITNNTKTNEFDGKLPNEKLALIDDSIRLCTDALSSLAYAFQRDNKARFAANVMTYHLIDSLKEDSDKEAVLDLLDNMIETRSFDGLQGYLMLDKRLTSSTDDPNDSFAVDELAENFALPVPDSIHSRHNDKLLRVLPGAPYALFFGEHIVDDTHEIKSAIRSGCDLATSISENIHKYFTECDPGKAIRSFVSLRFTRFNEELNEHVALGVVNVHCDQVKLFEEDDVARSFIALSQPFLDLIAKLLIRRDELQSEGVSYNQNG